MYDKDRAVVGRGSRHERDIISALLSEIKYIHDVSTLYYTLKRKLLLKFISSDYGKYISSRAKKRINLIAFKSCGNFFATRLNLLEDVM